MAEKKKMAVEPRLVYTGVKATARRLGCSREHLSRVLHGHLKPNEQLARRLQRMGFDVKDGKVIAE